MKAKDIILELANKKGIKAETIAKAMKYTHVNSFYRALTQPNKISVMRLNKLAKSLGIDSCELLTIIK